MEIKKRVNVHCTLYSVQYMGGLVTLSHVCYMPYIPSLYNVSWWRPHYMTAAECRVEVLPSVGKFIKLLPNPHIGLCNPFLCSTGVKYI